MKSAWHFIFNHSVLLCPNLYSTNLHNSLRTCSILALVHTNSTLLYCLLGYFGTSYNSSARTPQKTRVTYQTASSLIRYQHWAWRGQLRKHSLIYCCVLDRVHGAVAWQRVDQICFNILAIRLYGGVCGGHTFPVHIEIFQSCYVASDKLLNVPCVGTSPVRTRNSESCRR
jgi:hypothetical protein